MEAQRVARTLLSATVECATQKLPTESLTMQSLAVEFGAKHVRRGRTQLNSRTPLLCRSIRPDYKVFL